MLRKHTDYFLIGHPEQAISGSKLPTVRSVLKNFLYVKQQASNNNEALRLVVDNVLCFWAMARIPTMLPRSCVRNLERLYKEWRTIGKHKDRASDPVGRRNNFEEKLDKLWDVGADNDYRADKKEVDFYRKGSGRST